MKLIIILLLFISSCGMNQIQPSYTKQYLVSYTYSCPENYNMAIDIQNRRFCVIKDDVASLYKSSDSSSLLRYNSVYRKKKEKLLKMRSNCRKGTKDKDSNRNLYHQRQEV